MEKEEIEIKLNELINSLLHSDSYACEKCDNPIVRYGYCHKHFRLSKTKEIIIATIRNIINFVYSLNETEYIIALEYLNKNKEEFSYSQTQKKIVDAKKEKAYYYNIVKPPCNNYLSYIKKIKNEQSKESKIKMIIEFLRDKMYEKNICDKSDIIKLCDNFDEIECEANMYALEKEYQKIEKLWDDYDRQYFCFQQITRIVEMIYKARKTGKIDSFQPTDFSSKPEEEIWIFLKGSIRKEFSIIHLKRQKRFKDVDMSRFSFDFYGLMHCSKNFVLPFVIEYDGDSHFKNDLFGLKSDKIKRDMLKDFYLWTKGVSLLRICYKDRTNDLKLYIREFFEELKKEQLPIYKFRNKDIYTARLNYMFRHYKSTEAKQF